LGLIDQVLQHGKTRDAQKVRIQAKAFNRFPIFYTY
jgi:hypothetical protein